MAMYTNIYYLEEPTKAARPAHDVEKSALRSIDQVIRVIAASSVLMLSQNEI